MFQARSHRPALEKPAAETQSAQAPKPAPLVQLASVAAAQPAPPAAATNAVKRAPYQLSNVNKSIDALLKVESAILMRNALIDTRETLELGIPAELRATEDPGAYIIQATGPTTAAFQKMLRDAGAEIVSYIPNNAFLVKADANAAQVLREQPSVQAAIPYEPYYKIDTRLMKHVVENQPLSEDAWLRVTLFPGTEGRGLDQVSAHIGAREHSPFGEQVFVQPRADMLAAMAHLPEVQAIEPWNPRIAANDLTRERLGVSTNTVTSKNYLDLTGSNVWLNLNDIGVDATHPALQGRVFYQGNNARRDTNGHGTHIAGTIIGAGVTNVFDKISTVSNTLRFITNTAVVNGISVTNVYFDGSLTNADFRGIAPLAKLFILPTEFNPRVNTPVTDTYLIETAAQTNYDTLKRTNTLISNNSWNYANSTDYDSQAARYDAATRDALPDATGSQPVLYVFAAGNQGNGDEDGTGGQPTRIASPGTAKNVITVGALESLRYIAQGLTNITETVEQDDNGESITNRTTNVVQIFLPTTDSNDQVASYSSRGNTGIAIESGYGRFKPDVVAPGTFLLSAKSRQWDLKNDYSPTDPTTKDFYDTFKALNDASTEYRYDSGTSFAAGGISGMLALVQEFFSEKLPVESRRNLSPALMKALLINRSHSVHTRYDYAIRSPINYQGWGLPTLPSLLATNLMNTNGVFLTEENWPIILIDQTPTNAVATGEERVWKLQLPTNSAAFGLKVTLVWTDPPGNPLAGKKLVNDLDLIVEAPETATDTNSKPKVLYGNDMLNGRNITEVRDGNSNPEEYRDVINNVENVFIDIPRTLGSGKPEGTELTIKVVGRRVNVKAVNDFWAASTADIDKNRRTNDIVQDFALVISSEQTRTNKTFTSITRQDAVNTFGAKQLTSMANGIEATNRIVGANSAMYWTNGNIAQWHFFSFTNVDTDPNSPLKAGQNVAFITSLPNNVSTPRNLEPDIDMYVSKDPKLLDLDTNILATAWKSVGPGGNEQVVFAKDRFIPSNNPTNQPLADLYPTPGGVITNVAAVGDVFYIAVKSEDQKAGDFSFIAISTDQPFEEDRDGTRIIRLFSPGDIPDGTANHPQAHRSFGIGVRGGRVLEASVYFALSHEELGDLVGNIHHNNFHITLNNHTLNNGDYQGTNAFIYTDSAYDDRIWDPADPEYQPSTEPGIDYGGFTYAQFAPPTYQYADGPNILASLAGAQIPGTWMLDIIDSAATHVGFVHYAEMHVKPIKPPLLNGEPISGTVAPGGAEFFLIDVPANAIKLTFNLEQTSGNAPMIMLVKRDSIPFANTNGSDFDFTTTVTNGVATIVIDANSKPPLYPGEYFIALINPGTVPANFTLTPFLEIGSFGANLDIIGGAGIRLKDDARTKNTQFFGQDSIVTDASIAIITTNARVSDLSFRLTSPQGTSLLLAENRGFNSTNQGFGSTNLYTVDSIDKMSYAIFSDHIGEPVKFRLPPFGDADAQRGEIFSSGFENDLDNAYLPGATLIEGWQVRSNTVLVGSVNAYRGQKSLFLGKGAVSKTLSTVKGRSYRLSFAYRGQPPFSRAYITNNTDWMTQPSLGSLFSTGQGVDGTPDGYHVNTPTNSVDWNYSIIDNPDPNYPKPTNFIGSILYVANTNALSFLTWRLTNAALSDAFSQWIALNPTNDPPHPAGFYTNRTTFFVHENAAETRINGRVAADDGVVDILLNGNSVLFGMPPMPFGSSANRGSTNAFSDPFTIANGITLGLNTLQFVVTNKGGQLGLRAQLSLAIDDGTLTTDSSKLIPNSPTLTYVRMKNGSSTNVNAVLGAADWRVYAVDFIADDVSLDLDFYPRLALSGVEIDDVLLEDTGTVFLLPEEPLALLNGERAMGEWTLEAWDNRTGMVVPSEIVEWQLILADSLAPRVAEALAPGVRYPATINNPIIKADTNTYSPGNLIRAEFEYFYVDICDTATAVSITLASPATNTTAVQMLADWSGFPTGDPARDDYQAISTTARAISTIRLDLTTNSPASSPLRPGKRLFLAVKNFNRFATNSFQLRVLPNGCVFTAPQALALNTPAQDFAFPNGEGDPGNGYTAQTASAASVNVAIQGAGSLEVIAAKGFDPSPENYEARAVVSGSGALALPSGGNWFVRVLNSGANVVPYTIEVTGGSGPAGFDIHNVSISGGHLRVAFESVIGTRYEIASSTDLTNWTVVTTVTATAAETIYTDSADVSGKARYLRIRAVAP
jgi:subtilisin family serine protease/subtilisin-like proprotein convertase family protein